VILFSEDIPRAVGFYMRLGFVERFRVPAEGEPIHVDLELDGYRIGFASVASTRADHGLDPIATGSAPRSFFGPKTPSRRTRIWSQQAHRPSPRPANGLAGF
jgi:hypothetical protein